MSRLSLHICYVEMGYPHDHSGGGGAGTYVRLVGRALVRQGHRVSVVTTPCPQCSRQTTDEGIVVYRPEQHHLLHWYTSKLPGVRGGSLAIRYLEQSWSIARFLTRLHRRHPIDLVEYTEGGDFWHAFRAPFPYIAHLHGSRYTFLHMSGRPTNRGDWYHRRLELAFIKRAHYVVAPSQALLDVVEQELGEKLYRRTVLPLPLEPKLSWQHPPADVSKVVPHIVLFAARNDPVKGGDTLLRAAALVERELPDVEFHCFGYEPQPGTHVPDSVRCYSFVAKEDLLAHYRRADICVVPSLWDNSPNTVYEAMAAGKPVVASRVGGIPELVADGETGLLVEPGDHQLLAAAIVRLLRDEEARRAMGRRGSEHIHRLADLHENVGKRLDLYQNVLSDWASTKSAVRYSQGRGAVPRHRKSD